MKNPILLEQWRKQLQERSGNLTTNEVMPPSLIEKLLEEDEKLSGNLSLEDVDFPGLEGKLKEFKGLNIIAGLQNFTKDGCLTLFRSVRFPTYKRMHEVVYDKGFAVLNYEQERILELYKREDYAQKRDEMKQNPLFWTQPQERVVKGLPLFCLVNDALQIHRAFRGEEDIVLMVAVHIPHELLETEKIKLVSNPAIDLDYSNEERDFEIKDFTKSNGAYEIDYTALRARGIDLHEMYCHDLPWGIEEAENIGITQDFFLLDIAKIDKSKLYNLKANTELLKKNRKFLHGFFGDQNIFGRREAEYLPFKCQKITRK